MNQVNIKRLRLFSPAAREAAARARQRRKEERQLVGTTEVFVIRDWATPQSFRWEIRKYGGVLLQRSLDTYLTGSAARYAGLAALDGVKVETLS